MQSPFQIAVFLLAVCGIWCVWTYGLKKFCLDSFRENLFELRFELFKLGASEEVPFGSDTYRSLETLLNGLLRFAHRLTAASYFAALIQNARAARTKDHVDFSKQLTLKISRMPLDSQKKLCDILKKVNSAVILYMVFSSLPLLFLCLCGVLYLRLKNIRTSVKDDLCSAVEEEAYTQELRYPEYAVA